MRLMSLMLQRIIRKGHLAVVDASGTTHHFGERDEPAVTIRLHDERVAREIGLHPALKVGEAYMDGRLTVEGGATIADFLDLAMRNMGMTYGGGHMEWLSKARYLTRRLAQWNTRRRATLNSANSKINSGRSG